MKKSIKLTAAALLLAALAFAACTTDGGAAGTPEPMQTGAVPTGEGLFGMVTGSPTGTPERTSAPETQSAEPMPSASPEANGMGDSIEGFMTGRVIDPSEIPDIVSALGREFPEHTVQSVTEELYRGSEAYKVTLQGDGELARTVFVFADGSILIPPEGD